MTTSNSIDFIVNRDDIITESLEICGVLGEGEAPNDDQIISCSRSLNMMTKAWQAEGLNLFAVQRTYLFLEKNVGEYSLDSSTAANFTTAFTETTLAVAATTTDTTVTVVSATGISDGDNIGIGSGTNVQWTTVSGAPVGDVITLTDALTADSSIGDVVYTYTLKAARPMQLMEGYVHITGGTDIPVGKIARERYFDLANKKTEGVVNQVYFDSQINKVTLFVWPETDDERSYLILLVQRTLQDFDASGDTPDYPQEWYLPLTWGLALLIAPKYGVPSTNLRAIKVMADEWYERAEGFDSELWTSVYFRPDRRGEDVPS